MTQLGSLKGPSSLETLKDLKVSTKKAPAGKAPEKPDSSFADLIQQNEAKITPRKPVEDARSADRTEKGEKPNGVEEKKGTDKDAQFDQEVEPGKAEKGSTKKERAMLEFMDSMESELGIPPTKIVEAMAQLNPSDIRKSPEETAQQVIENLDLPPEEFGTAFALYMAFLQQSKTSDSKPEQMFIQQPMVAAQPGLNALSPELRREKINQSLDVMNQKFFMQNQKLSDQKPGALEIPQGMELVQESAPKAKQPFLTEMEMEALAERQAENPIKTPMETPLMAPDMAKIKSAQAKSPKTTPDDFFALGALKAQMGDQGKVPPKAEMPMMDQASVPNESAVQQLASAMPNEASDQGDSFMNTDGSSQEKTNLPGKSAKVSADDFFPSLGLGTSSKSEAPQSLNAVVAKDGAQTQVNIDKLADQAKMIVFKGGGEAVVKLNPDGMGEVRLKILVQDGKVNLEMATETKEAKKLIESSISELRNSLAGHKLTIDQVKVDVGNQASTDSQGQKNMDAKPDLNQGRQFMSQFRDEMSGRRDSFVEMPGLRGYQSKRSQPDPIAAAPEVSSASRRSSSPGRGQRMNLVA